MSGFTIQDILCLFRDFYLNLSNYNESHKRMMNPSGLKDLLIDIPQVKWEEIGGYEQVKEEIRRVTEWPLKYPESFKKLGLQPSKGILLYGPPGCSKTLLARALCTQCNMSFMAVKGPEIFSKYVGDSEKAIREIFRKARMFAPSVIFFDEIDAIAPQRTNSTDVADRVLIQLLTEIDGFDSLKNVIIIGATNRPQSIDKALLRPGRFDHLILIDVPDKDARAAIFQVCFEKMSVAQNVKDALQSFVDQTNGYTEKLVRSSEILSSQFQGLIALQRSLQVEMIEVEDFRQAMMKVKASVTNLDRQSFIQFAEKLKL